MKIFVSSTYEDLKIFREAVKDAIIAKQHVPIMMETLIPEGENPPQEECLQNVEECNIFVGIYAYRYGFIPEGEKASITEQEYDKAVDENKKLYCFVLHTDLEKEWPAQFKDNTPQVREFRAKILKDNYVKFFKNPDELKYLVTQALPFETAETRFERALEDAQTTAKRVKDDLKLKMIDRIIQEKESGRLKDEALKYATKLIASNFTSFDRKISYELINNTKRLIDSKIRLADFVDSANELTKKVRTRIFMGKAAWIGIVFLIIGILLTLFAYQVNLGGIRSSYISPNSASRIDVLDWLTNKVVGENIEYGNVSSPGTIKAMAALGFAYEIDSENIKLHSSLDRLITDVRKLTRPTNTPFEILQSNLKILEETYKYVPYPPLLEEAHNLTGRYEISRLALDFDNAQVSDKQLLEGYNELLINHKTHVDTSEVRAKIKELQNSATNFENLNAIAVSDTATITEKKELWQTFAASHRESPEKVHALAETEKINDLITSNASISTLDNFVACRSISNLNPQGKATHFSPGSVCAWAQVCAPKSELVYFKWYANGGLFHTFSVRVDRHLEPGYRVHSAKNYSSEHTGKQEVRLYNSQNQLIGRRVFYVGQ